MPRSSSSQVAARFAIPRTLLAGFVVAALATLVIAVVNFRSAETRAAAVQAMDRTTLTAALKPLERRGLVQIVPDEADRRSRRLILTAAGRTVLAAAMPIWQRTHAAVEAALPGETAEALRTALRELG